MASKGAEPVTLDDVLTYVDKCSRWDDVDADVYVEICKELGLCYEDYDDPDELWMDVKSTKEV